MLKWIQRFKLQTIWVGHRSNTNLIFNPHAEPSCLWFCKSLSILNNYSWQETCMQLEGAMKATSGLTVWNATTPLQTHGHSQHPWQLAAAAHVCWHAVRFTWLVEWVMLGCHSTLGSILTMWQTHGGLLRQCVTNVQVHLEQLRMEKSMSLVSLSAAPTVKFYFFDIRWLAVFLSHSWL